nr:hypothetical protein [Streptomyces leeuwenhoekii]
MADRQGAVDRVQCHGLGGRGHLVEPVEERQDKSVFQQCPGPRGAVALCRQRGVVGTQLLLQPGDQVVGSRVPDGEREQYGDRVTAAPSRAQVQQQTYEEHAFPGPGFPQDDQPTDRQPMLEQVPDPIVPS